MTISKDERSTSQRERFEQAARELGVELDEEKLKRALKAIAHSTPTGMQGDKDRETSKHSKDD